MAYASVRGQHRASGMHGGAPLMMAPEVSWGGPTFSLWEIVVGGPWEKVKGTLSAALL